MTFSNVNVFNSSYKALNSSVVSKSEPAINKGGAFSPTVLEASSIMRASFDEQWENAYIIKYQALMQNRLNSLKQKLQAAYNNLVQQSTSQQVRENGANNEVTATTDVYGRMLPGTNGAVNNAFKDLAYYGSQADIDADDQKGLFNSGTGTDLDGVPSYLMGKGVSTGPSNTYYAAQDAAGNKIETGLDDKVYEMRKLFVSGAAMQISNTMKVTFRSEEVPPKAPEDIGILGTLGETENPANKPGEKISEGSVEVKTGGFWSTVNYLYNFAPRELKYSYATSYSTTTEEAGTRNYTSGGIDRQATLFSRRLVDGRDMQDTGSGGRVANTSAGEDQVPGALDGNTNPSDPNYPKYGARVKWVSSTAEEGYTTELNALSDITGDPGVRNYVEFDSGGPGSYDDRLIRRRRSDNDSLFINMDEFNSFGDAVKGPNAAGGNDWKGYTTDPVSGDQYENKVKIYGTEDMGVTDINSRILWQYEHDGIGAADINRDSRIDNTDKHDAKAAFINHYQVAVREVELNSNPDSFGQVLALGHTRKNSNLAMTNPYDFVDVNHDNIDDESGESINNIDLTNKVASALLRSGGLDLSADHSFSDVDEKKDPTTGKKLIHQENVADDGTGQDKNEKLLLPGASKIAKNFTPKFVEDLHKIRSFNGQAVGAKGGNLLISSETANSDPLVLAEYEGFTRATMMSVGMADDYFNDFGKQVRTYDQAVALKKKLEAEVNASSMVDTDWHYSEYNSTAGNTTLDGIMFRNIKQITYNDPDKGSGSLDIYYDAKKRDDPNNDTFQYVDPLTGQQSTQQGIGEDTFNNVNVAFRKTFKLNAIEFQRAQYQYTSATPVGTVQDPFFVTTPVYQPKPVNISIDTRNVDMNTFQLIVNGQVVTPASIGATTAKYDIGAYLKEGDNVIASQMLFNGTSAPNNGGGDYFKITADTTVAGANANTADVNKWLDERVSTERAKTSEDKSTKLTTATNAGIFLSGWQSKVMAARVIPQEYANIYKSTAQGGTEPVFITVDNLGNPGAGTQMSERAYNEYKNAVRGLGSEQTATKVKDMNVFAKTLVEAMNSKEYRDIFTLGLWNSNVGKDIVLQSQVSSPNGGNVQSSIKIKYNPVNGMFSILQTKWDASAGQQQ